METSSELHYTCLARHEMVTGLDQSKLSGEFLFCDQGFLCIEFDFSRIVECHFKTMWDV